MGDMVCYAYMFEVHRTARSPAKMTVLVYGCADFDEAYKILQEDSATGVVGVLSCQFMGQVLNPPQQENKI